MRRFKSLLSPVISASIAFTTLAVAALFAPRGAEGGDPRGESGVEGTAHRSGQDRRFRRLHAVPLVAVLAVGATAFAAGAGTPSSGSPIAVGDQIPHSTPTTAGPSTLPATAEAAAAAVDAQKDANVRVMKAIAKAKDAAAKAEAEAKAKAAAKAAAEAKARAEAKAAAAAAAAAARPAPAPVQVSGACGGNLPPCCVMMRESGGNPTAVNPSSGASGKWQFMPSTWANYGGYPTAASAPESVQDQRAAQIWAGGAGAGHWGGGC
jgi:hypothetical protein